MKLRFRARPGKLCALPGPRVKGTYPRYVGRKVVVTDKLIVNQPVDEPAEFDSASKEGRRLLRLMAVDAPDYPLWPADEETARACGCRFQQLSKNANGEWEPQRAVPVTRSSRKTEAD